MADDETKHEEPAPGAEGEREPGPPKRQARQAANSADARADADAAPALDPDAAEWHPPEVWLKYNPKSGLTFGHVPTEGSGPDGEFSPEEVAHHFPTKPQYDAATKAPEGREPLYRRVKKPEGTRDPAAWWKSTNPDAYGKEGNRDEQS